MKKAVAGCCFWRLSKNYSAYHDIRIRLSLATGQIENRGSSLFKKYEKRDQTGPVVSFKPA